MKGYFAHPEYEALFDMATGRINENTFEQLRHRDVFRYRVKTITSGPIRECEIFPIWATRKQTELAYEGMRELEDRNWDKYHDHTVAVRNVNARNARKNFVRKVNANFGEDDLTIYLTYAGEQPNEAEAAKEVRNFIRRLKSKIKKRGLPELKYMYVTEAGRKSGRIHHHVILSGDMERGEIEKTWMRGRANAIRLQPDEGHIGGMASYLMKDPKGKKRWCCSRNLKQPKITTADCKLSKYAVEKLAKDVNLYAPIIFERLNDGYDFSQCEIKRSEFVAGAYIYARMRRKE